MTTKTNVAVDPATDWRGMRSEAVAGAAAPADERAMGGSEPAVRSFRFAPFRSDTPVRRARRVAWDDGSELNEREFTVATLIGAGASNDQIAARLSVPRATVDRQISIIMDKLGFRRRVQIAGWVARQASSGAVRC